MRRRGVHGSGGVWLTRQLPEPALLLVMGGLVTCAVLLVMRGARVPMPRGTRGAVAAGAVGGFMNSAAGVGGPPVSLYAVNAGRLSGSRPSPR